MQHQQLKSSFDIKTLLFIALGFISVFYLYVLLRGILRARTGGAKFVSPTPGGLATGFFTNFLETLGIGSFATTTAIFRQWRMVRDEQIPGTLNIGHSLPTIAQAFIFTTLVPVDAKTLISMIGAAALGSHLGAGTVSRWSRPLVQLVMGAALLVAAVLLLMKQLKLMPGGGTALELTGTKLAIGLVGNFILGALMTMGIGLYAPCMILIYTLGMDPAAAFPIMMGSCAFLMPVASARFLKEMAFDPRGVLSLAIGGVPAVIIAAKLVKSLTLTAMLWLVIVVVLYTAAMLLTAARRERDIKSISTADQVPSAGQAVMME